MKFWIIALDKVGEETECFRNFLEDIPNWSKSGPTIFIYSDSQAAIGRARNIIYNGKSQHIRQIHSTIKQLLSSGIITIYFVRSKNNIAYPLTKGLTRELVESSSKGMGLKPIIWKLIREETQPSWLEIPRSKFKGQTNLLVVMSTKLKFDLLPFLKIIRQC